MSGNKGLDSWQILNNAVILRYTVCPNTAIVGEPNVVFGRHRTSCRTKGFDIELFFRNLFTNKGLPYYIGAEINVCIHNYRG